MNEAHVQHAVGLVQDEDFNMLQGNMSLTDQVVEPAGSGHQNVHPTREGFHLRLLPHAAENDAGGERQVLPVAFKVFKDLQRQFARRGKNQGADGTPARVLLALLAQALQDGQGERGGLAGARLGAAQHVAPRQNGRNGLALDGCGLVVAHVAHSGQQGRNQVQIVKMHAVPFLRYVFESALNAAQARAPCACAWGAA